MSSVLSIVGSEITSSLNQFDILRLAETAAPNFRIDTEDLITRLKELDEQVGIDIWHATADLVSFKLLSTPKDKLEVAKELFELCPDLEDGGEKLDEFAEKLRKRHVISLWWD